MCCVSASRWTVLPSPYLNTATKRNKYANKNTPNFALGKTAIVAAVCCLSLGGTVWVTSDASCQTK